MSTSQGIIVDVELVSSLRQSEPASAKEIREEAEGVFSTLGFPNNKHEEYRFTPISRNLERIISASMPPAVASFTDIKPYLIPGLDANCIVFVNGRFDEKLSSIISPKSQVAIQSLPKALDENAAVVRNHFAKLVDFKSDGFAAFNTAFWQDGIFIHVPKNTIVEKPILILHLQDGVQQPVVAPTRLLMVLEENSQAMLIERSESKGVVFSSWVEEIAVKEKAVLNYCKLQNDSGEVYQVATTLIHQEASSRVNTFTLTLNGKMIRNNFGIAIDGERCESHFYGLYLLDKDTLADNHTVVDHRKPNSFSNQLYKGILNGTSRGVFNGKIYVRPHAQKTNAFQSNRNVLLNDTSVIHTKPQLEIWADDVKCSHGCTSGQLDDEALFYLQSRGISKANAQAMLLYAFAGEILDPLKNEALKNFLDQIISDRLHKGF